MFTNLILGIISIFAMLVFSLYALNRYNKSLELAPKIEEKDVIEQKIVFLKQELEEKRNEQQALKQELEDAKIIIEKKEDAQRFLDENQDEINDLKNFIKNESNTLEKVKQETEDKKLELQELKKQCLDKETSLSSVTVDLEYKQRQIVNLESDLSYKEAQKESLTNDINSLKSEKNNLETAVQNLQEEKKKVDDLKEQAKELEAKIQQSNLIEQKLLDLQNQLQTLNDEISTKESDKKQLSNELIVLEQKKIQAEAVISLLHDKESRLNQVEIDLKQLETNKAILETEISNQRQKLTQINTEINDSSDKLDQIRRTISAEENKLNSLGINIQNLEEKQGKLEKEVDDLLKQKASLNNEISSLCAKQSSTENSINLLNQQLEELTNQKEKINKELIELQGANNAASLVKAEREAQIKDTEQRWSELDKPIITNNNRNIENINESEWLNDFTNLLEKNNIIFNSRLIKAFHTGLKCADASPLVVLAGISGTGKSLLPELYAEALGMNFLSVAVQPRWDSPQDMFGFYNYMESRYKATDLARFLWQFDMFNNPNYDKNNPNYVKNSQRPINLVLLDEMNLAKVEYYFSDMLSKLETRRGLDPQIKHQRYKAEVTLEGGNLGEETSRQLFVASNTLFVGTMNEDESTQTLSDKVIDRSNVLRFGKPSSLGNKPNKDYFVKECENLPVITFENWRKWQQPNDRAFYMESLKAINDCLEKVGRPFAHRVWQAMTDYISYYPGNSEEDINNALADQIEMKILPKLDGIELEADGFDEVKKKLEEVINQIGDNELKNAFEVSCDSKNAFFKWHGVLRQ